ncbi:response regulator [Paenibacillus sp. P96]|uniref:Response regulator n=2 Tax=Paenibacillus zeirhizosphaerae TaxID=2987519 RepID=A0ABT9FR05_9BACL|nr:response regulator [Paenibacillus sp. P96]MDP4097150.1 response regulator [Paenibacillus sp. P96]
MLKVLLVDDEHWNRDMIRSLGEWDHIGLQIVGEAGDGIEAVRLTEALEPEIVITDMRMPAADGVELLRILKERFPEIRTIVISGYDDFNYAKHALKYRSVDYLLKPIDPQELNAALQKCKTELQDSQKSRLEPFDLECSQRLSGYKQSLRSYFHELNREGITVVFGQLQQELQTDSGHRKLGRVVQELLLHLKELVAAAMPGAEQQEIRVTPHTLSSAEAAVHDMQQYYMQALDALIQQRKFKNKLNLEEIRQYMEQHFTEPITLEFLAKVFFVSKEYLSKVFKQEYGVNVTDYIVQLRMEKAREWIVQEQHPIKTVCEMAGYEDVSYFYRVFKKYFGIAPGEMRKQNEV